MGIIISFLEKSGLVLVFLEQANIQTQSILVGGAVAIFWSIELYLEPKYLKIMRKLKKRRKYGKPEKKKAKYHDQKRLISLFQVEGDG